MKEEQCFLVTRGNRVGTKMLTVTLLGKQYVAYTHKHEGVITLQLRVMTRYRPLLVLTHKMSKEISIYCLRTQNFVRRYISMCVFALPTNEIVADHVTSTRLLIDRTAKIPIFPWQMFTYPVILPPWPRWDTRAFTFMSVCLFCPLQ